MKKWKNLSEIRRDYGSLSLCEEAVAESPFDQFEQWFKEVLQTEINDPTAMVLATVDEQGHPDARVVLLKGLEDESFIFYTNYQSTKAMQIAKNSYVSLNFYWPQTARQVRIRGRIQKISSKQSDEYFASRPLNSQLSAIGSPQSQEIKNRDELEKRFNELVTAYQQTAVVRPQSWGGYAVIPHEIEFWQGRDNRLHDRIHYALKDEQWVWRRLAP